MWNRLLKFNILLALKFSVASIIYIVWYFWNCYWTCPMSKNGIKYKDVAILFDAHIRLHFQLTRSILWIFSDNYFVWLSFSIYCQCLIGSVDEFWVGSRLFLLLQGNIHSWRDNNTLFMFFVARIMILIHYGSCWFRKVAMAVLWIWRELLCFSIFLWRLVLFFTSFFVLASRFTFKLLDFIGQFGFNSDLFLNLFYVYVPILVLLIMLPCWTFLF